MANHNIKDDPSYYGILPGQPRGPRPARYPTYAAPGGYQYVRGHVSLPCTIPYPSPTQPFQPPQYQQPYPPYHTTRPYINQSRGAQYYDQGYSTSRPRNSYAGHQEQPLGSSSRPIEKPTHRPATDKDLEKYGIPKGYNLEDWDPTEEPIVLLGSVFDANSLGKWIYDWTAHVHGPNSPFADIANDLWLLLIQVAGNTQLAKECLADLKPKDKKIAQDFIARGDLRLERLRKLVRKCEKEMPKAEVKDGMLGKRSGIEFVEIFFGRDERLKDTEEFMSQLRLWVQRFEEDCRPFIKPPPRR